MKGIWKSWYLPVLPVLSMLAGCSPPPVPAYPPPPFERKVDVSKPGVLYEADFTVPDNSQFAPMKLEFGVPHTQYELVLRIADTVPGRLEREVEEFHSDLNKHDVTDITIWSVVGFWGDSEYFGKLSVEQLKTYVRPMKYPGTPIQLKITLTPHPNTRKPIDYISASDDGTGRRILLAPAEPLQVILNLSTFAQVGNPGSMSQLDKLLLLFPDLELQGNYHLRVENVTPINLPTGIETTLIQRQARITK